MKENMIVSETCTGVVHCWENHCLQGTALLVEEFIEDCLPWEGCKAATGDNCKECFP